MRIVVLIALLVPAFAYAACPMDTTGTQPTDDYSEYGLTAQVPCRNCREISKFPGDVGNAAWNYVMVGSAAGVYDKEYGIGSIGYKLGPESSFTIRVKNGLGQTENVTIITVFRTLSVSGVAVSLQTRTSIKGWRVFSVSPSGVPSTAPYEYQKILESTAFKIPSSAGDDGYTAGEDCLKNDGTVRTSGGGSDGGGGGGGISPSAPRCYRDRGDRYVCD